MLRARLTALLVTAAALTLPAVATASPTHYAPPGKAGSTEYFETIPASGGNVAPPSAGSTGSDHAIATIGRGAAGSRRLSRLGATGKAAAAFSAATAPTRGPGAGAPSSMGGIAKLARSPGGSALSGLLHLLGGSDAGGIGVFMPLLLAASLLGALLLGAIRWRRREDAV